MTGKNGTFSLGSNASELVSAGGIYAVLTAELDLRAAERVPTRASAAGAAFVAVMLPGDDSFRYEGYVRAG